MPLLYEIWLRLRHDEGETDMRGCYCAIATASMLHILTDELMEGVPEYIRRCQTWEGGIAGEEGLEARKEHGNQINMSHLPCKR